MDILGVIQGTPYSCESDKNILLTNKMALDYHKLNFGNTNKSTVTAPQLQLMELEYEASKKKYDNSTCGKNVDRDKCIALKAQIEALQSNISYLYSVRDNESAIKRTTDLDALKKIYEESKCSSEIGEFRADNIKSIIDVYSTIDKNRIEEESKYQAKQRIFFGVLVLLGAVAMVSMFGKK